MEQTAEAGRPELRTDSWLVIAAIALIRTYRFLLSPWLGMHCRFHPSCSRYAEEALRTHGPWRGLWLSLRRLSRCHPWHEGGLDPVPDIAKEK